MHGGSVSVVQEVTAHWSAVAEHDIDAHLAVVAVSVVVIAAAALPLASLPPLVRLTHLHRRNALRVADALQHHQHRVLRDMSTTLTAQGWRVNNRNGQSFRVDGGQRVLGAQELSIDHGSTDQGCAAVRGFSFWSNAA